MRRRLREVGVYALVLQVPRKTRITVGRLGSLQFVPGVYVYIGSGLNSLQGRIRRHFNRAKRIHWHIDYLTRDPRVKLLSFAVRLTNRKIECAMSRAVQMSALTSVARFGSSDCDCDSHLHRFARFSNASQVLGQHRFQFRNREDVV
jgi:Uri superfamily endonuclease